MCKSKVLSKLNFKIVEYFTSNSRKVTGGCAGVWFLLGTSMASSRSCGFGATCPCSAILKSYHRQQFPVGVTNSILGWKSSSWTPAKNLSISYNYLHTDSTSLFYVQKFNFNKTLLLDIFEFLHQNWKVFLNFSTLKVSNNWI